MAGRALRVIMPSGLRGAALTFTLLTQVFPAARFIDFLTPSGLTGTVQSNGYGDQYDQCRQDDQKDAEQRILKVFQEGNIVGQENRLGLLIHRTAGN